jgi:hypothetical protein
VCVCLSVCLSVCSSNNTSELEILAADLDDRDLCLAKYKQNESMISGWADGLALPWSDGLKWKVWL